MMKCIKNEEDYVIALSRVGLLMDAKPNTDEFDELKELATLIEDYEDKYYAIDMPAIIEAVRFRME